MSLSPDGRRIAAGVFGMRSWLDEPPMIGEVGRQHLRALAKGSEERNCYSPAFSPDGRFLAYRCSDGIGEVSSGGIYLRPADGRGAAEKILHLHDNAVNWASSVVFSADSSRLLVREQTAGPSPWLSLAVPAGAADAESLESFLPAEVDARDLQFAPGGKFIVYSSRRNGVPVVFARMVAPGGGPGEEIRLSPRSGREPRLRTGPPEVEQEVVYITDDPEPGSPRIMSVRVRSGGKLTVTPPSAIPGGSVDEMRLLGPRYSVLPDGSIFFVQSPPDPEGPSRIQIILNFDVEVRRKLELVERGRTS